MQDPNNPNNGIATVHGIVTQDQFDHLTRKLMTAFEELSKKIDDKEEWLTAEEAQTYLKIGSTKLYSLIKDGTINKYKLGGSVRFNKNELREVMFNDQ